MAVALKAPYHNPGLTGIRAVACLWVVLSHVAMGYKPALPHSMLLVMTPGYLGVDLFFVLSGFILTCVHPRLGFRPTALLRFFLKRVFRIYPLNIAVMLFMAADAWRIGAFGSVWYDPHHFLPYVLMIAVFYTDPPITGWLATNWSLGVELVCYLGFPILVGVLRSSARPWLALLFAALLVGEIIVQRQWLGVPYGLGAMMRGAAGFSLGAAAAMLTGTAERPGRLLASATELACAAAIAVCVVTQVLWPVGVLMAGLIIAVSFRSGILASLLATRPVVWIGDISYSIYLVHGVLLGEWGWYWLALGRSAVPDPAISFIWVAGFLAATVAISAFTYYAVEIPCRRLGGAAIDHLRIVGLGGSAASRRA